jgi:hypothetical protein
MVVLEIMDIVRETYTVKDEVTEKLKRIMLWDGILFHLFYFLTLLTLTLGTLRTLGTLGTLI